MSSSGKGRATCRADGHAPPFNVGLLGHGTVGSAFAELLDERADEIERFNGRTPRAQRCAHAQPRRLPADPRRRRSDRRGDGRASSRRASTCSRRCAPASTSSPPTSSCSPSTARSCSRAAREHDVRLRFEAAVAGAVPVVRVLEESLSATPIERIHGIVNGTTNFILSEMAGGSSYARGARRGPARRLRRGRPQRRRQRTRRGGEDGDPRAARVRLTRASGRGALRGHRAPPRRRPRVRARARPRR